MMSDSNEVIDQSVFVSKKRDASSPLQEPSLNLKKSKQLSSSLSDISDISDIDCSEPDSSSKLDLNSNSNQVQDMASSEAQKSVLTETDLDNIALRVKAMMMPVMKSMIDSSIGEIRKEYDKKLSEQDQKVNELCDENDELRCVISSLKSEVEKLKARRDDLEQYSRRNSIRISGVKESDVRPAQDIVLILLVSIPLMQPC